MGKRGPAGEEPILKSTELKDKKQIATRLYEDDKEVLERKLKKRGYSSISSWIRDQAKKVVLEQNLKERRDELLDRKNDLESELEDIKQEIEQVKQDLEGRNEELFRHYNYLKELLKKVHRKDKGMVTVKSINRIVYRIENRSGVDWSDEDDAEKCLGQCVSELLDNEWDASEFAEHTVEEIKENGLLRVEVNNELQ